MSIPSVVPLLYIRPHIDGKRHRWRQQWWLFYNEISPKVEIHKEYMYIHVHAHWSSIMDEQRVNDPLRFIKGPCNQTVDWCYLHYLFPSPSPIHLTSESSLSLSNNSNASMTHHTNFMDNFYFWLNQIHFSL